MTQKAETHFLLYLKYNRETESALSTVVWMHSCKKKKVFCCLAFLFFIASIQTCLDLCSWDLWA